MKARLAIGVIAGISIVALTLQGCSSSSNGPAASGGPVDGNGKTLTVMVGANALYPTQQKAWFSRVSDAFQKQTGAKVAFETFASANDELTKIQTSVISGQGPDLYTLGTTFTPTASATGAFVELSVTDWEKVGGRDRFVPATLGISGIDKTHEVGIPYASRPFVMAYNIDMLTAAGIDTPATTWDGLTAQAKKLTTGGNYGIALAYADSYDPWKFIWAMSLQAGNPILDGKKARIDDPTTLTAYQTYFDWYSSDRVVDPAAIGWKNSQAVAAFASGKAAFLPMTSANSMVTLDKSSVAGKYAYAVMPTVPPGKTSTPSKGKPASSIISGDNIVIAKYSPNRDLAFALVKMLTNEENQESYYTTFGELPTNAVAAKKLESANPALQPIVDSAAKSVGTPFSGAWGDTQLALVNVVVQSIPALSNGVVRASDLRARLVATQTAVQASLDKAR